jgi:flagellar basal-body rod modification protein FlgD
MYYVNNVLQTPVNQYVKTSSGSGDNLGKNDFLQLLTTQLQNQDPLEPIKNEEWLAQLAQFNSLEQMQNLNKTMTSLTSLQTLTQTASLIGKTIDATVNGSTITGVVQEAKYSTDGVTLQILGADNVKKSVALNEVIAIRG